MSQNKLRYITAKIGFFEQVFTESAFCDYISKISLRSGIKWHSGYGIQELHETLKKAHDSEHGDCIELIYDDEMRSDIVIKARRVTVIKKIRETWP